MFFECIARKGEAVKDGALKKEYDPAEVEFILYQFSDVIITSSNNDSVSSDMSPNGWTGW